MSDPDVSVVIPLYDDAATIPAVLAALDAQRTERRFEVIVVDDGSTDGGGGSVRPPHRLLGQANAGPAAARNRGAREARGRTILFLDADCVPPPGWVEAMAAAMVPGRVDAVMGTLVAGNDGVVPRLVQLEVEDRYRGMEAATEGVDFIAAPACGVARDVFHALGGFDERLRQAEDVEFAYRLTEAGYRIAFVGTVPVAHAHQTTWRSFLRAKYLRAQGRLRVFDLFPGKRRRDVWTPVRFKLQFAAFAMAATLALLAPLLGRSGWIGAALALAACVALGWPLVRATARRQASLIGYLPGLALGAGFVLIRSGIIAAAMAARAARRMRRRGS